MEGGRYGAPHIEPTSTYTSSGTERMSSLQVKLRDGGEQIMDATLGWGWEQGYWSKVGGKYFHLVMTNNASSSASITHELMSPSKCRNGSKVSGKFVRYPWAKPSAESNNAI